ncbi:hypothetical protein GWK08_18305 [Leptobacterium flavescens]|uniref:DUF1570 domain-containing protein n=1 Tax=Leptobacterium flavescens TaxID=472055 RepID=A0A6P0USA0_9FLAO|nr:hypothetical protein [Leptobacterium flavescens]NER15412.1 hypothetical protein [Leptobacterium flavescens]
MAKICSIICFLFLLQPALSQPGMRTEDKERIAEAVRISKLYGDDLWKGFNEVPFSIILVTDDYEYLIYHSKPTEDFKLLEHDALLNTDIYYRKTVFNKHFLATFPAVNGVNCIVVGTPENTNRNSSEWIITLLHEHFHQYVYSKPDYYKSVEGLNLSNGDRSGMWMLNYPFPYSSKKTIDAYADYTQVLKQMASGEMPAKAYYKKYRKARKQFKNSLSPDEYRYFSFQLWQEGIARYTEIRLLELLKDHKTSAAVAAMEDYEPFSELSSRMLANELNNITALKLEQEKRVCFYSVGMAEGLILDEIRPDWREEYLEDKFYLERYQKKE